VPVRLLRRPVEGVHLFVEHDHPLPQAHLRPAAGSHRHPRRSAARRVRPRRSEANGKLADDRLGEPSADIRARVEKAREAQRQRFAGRLGGAEGNVPLLCNADMGPGEVREHCPLDDAGKSLLRAAMTQLGMSARAFHRILKLARTIADLEGAVKIHTHQLAEAIQYRPRRQL